ncbi:MAG: outer membrane protein assembly factor BamA [Caulobacterales bacterium]
MKYRFREVVLGAVSVAAVSSGAVVLEPAKAFAQDTQPAPGQPVTGRPAQPALAPAQVAPNVVGRILVEGNQRIEAATVVSYLAIRPGDPIDSERIDQSIKSLFATGLFANVEVSERNGDLVVTVAENPIVSRVLFEGVRALKEEDLQKEIQAKPRSVFTAARAQADVQRIVELYRRSGRFAAAITPQVRQLDQNRVDLIFEIDEGPVTGVRSVNFLGNKQFSDRDLQDAILTEPSRWWKFFSRNDNYDPDRLEFDREKLRQFYTNQGYADFRVVSAVAELTPDQKDFFITFTVDEGQKYDFGKINVETKLSKVDPVLLKAVIPIVEGSQFRGEAVEKSIDAITFAAGAGGYASVEVRPRVERDRDGRKVNITFEVNEGPRVFVERIDIVGNSTTLDPVIRREIRLVEGDAFNRVLLDRSRGRIRGLGFFKDVEVEDKPGSEPDRSVVEVKVTEDSTGELAFAAGYSSSDSFLFDVSVTQRNLLGRGQFLRLRASTSQRRQQIDARFTEPRFLGRNLSAGIEAFSLRTDFLDESSFENQSTGMGLRAGFPITDTTSLGLTYFLRQDDTKVSSLICDPSITSNPALICAQQGQFLTSVLGYAFNWDRRNDPVKATRGFDLSLRQDFAGLGGEVKYLRTELEGGVYRGLLPDVIASFNMSAGYVLGWGDDQVRINDRFFKGGSSFRGFDVAGLGPRQILTVRDPATGTVQTFNQDALGGNAYAIGSLQLEFPTPLPKEFGVGGALFLDFGAVGLLDSRDKKVSTFTDPTTGEVSTLFARDTFGLRATTGLSVFWDSPFGPVQFDFAHPLAKEEYDRAKSFRFSTRTKF